MGTHAATSSRVTYGRARVAAVVALSLMLAGGSGMPEAEADGVGPISRNMRVIAHFPLLNGTDITFDDDSVIFGRFGGLIGNLVHVLDISGKKPHLVGQFECGSGQTDTAVVSPGIVAVGNHDGVCGSQPASGINLFDVSTPDAPKQLGFWPVPHGTHTLTAHPSEALIYTSDSGYLVNTATHIIDVSDPASPKEVAVVENSCHDITFRITKMEQLAFCAVGGSVLPGDGAIEIWDVKDPRDPRVVSRIADPDIAYPHLAAATPDGRYLVVGDEAAPGSCSQPSRTRDYGALSIYDIHDRTKPELVGFINVPRGTSSCWAHNFNFAPNTRLLVASWYDGGSGVYDLRDPADPVEIAHFRPDEERVWSAYWHRGRIYANGGSGLFVLELERKRYAP